MLRSEEIARLLRFYEDEPMPEGLTQDDAKDTKDPFIITPQPDLEKLRNSGSASVDLRLGCWFSALKKANLPALEVGQENSHRCSEEKYVPLGEQYILHPHSFVLAVTLEWIRLPKNLAAYIHGKSSWGRCGLIIATAAVIHPGFTGCITLELTNTGEVPLVIIPGMKISQLCLHQTTKPEWDAVDQSSFSGQRKPVLRDIQLDSIAEILMDKQYRNIDVHFKCLKGNQ